MITTTTLDPKRKYITIYFKKHLKDVVKRKNTLNTKPVKIEDISFFEEDTPYIPGDKKVLIEKNIKNINATNY